MTAGLLKPRFALVALIVAASLCAVLLAGGSHATAASQAAVAAAPGASASPSTAAANPYARYKRCKKIKFKQRSYRVVKLRMPCKSARRKTRYVLKKRKAPKRWTCSMPNFPINGVCSKKSKRFIFRSV
jgi:hypothetical protein